MSAALQSLMRQADAPQLIAERQTGGVLAFLLIGGSAALAFVILTSLLIAALPQVEGWIVSAICYAGFILPVYLLHRRYTFGSDVAHLQALPRYVAVQGMALLLATLFGYVFHGALALPGPSAAFLVILLTSGVNYLVLKGWAFAALRRQEIVAA